MLTAEEFRAAITRAAARAAREREERETCPKEQKGCGTRGSLCAVTRRGSTLGKLCPVCGWSTFELGEPKPKKRASSKKTKTSKKGPKR